MFVSSSSLGVSLDSMKGMACNGPTLASSAEEMRHCDGIASSRRFCIEAAYCFQDISGFWRWAEAMLGCFGVGGGGGSLVGDRRSRVLCKTEDGTWTGPSTESDFISNQLSISQI